MSSSGKPEITRQSSLEYLESATSGASQTSSLTTQLICSVCFLPPAIAAIAIASQYDASASECDDEQFLIDLHTFLYVAGAMVLADVVLHCMAACCAMMGASHDRTALMLRCILLESCCFALFHLVWAGIGLHIYNDEMSAACQAEAIGKMVLAWNVIIYVVFGSSICCLCCPGLCMGAVMLRTQKPFGDINTEEYQELNTANEVDDAVETDPLI